MKEFKVGESFDYKTKGNRSSNKYIACPSANHSCDGCDFYTTNLSTECKAPEMKCCSWEREDGKSVIYKKHYR